jgi:hypothetical protein
MITSTPPPKTIKGNSSESDLDSLAIHGHIHEFYSVINCFQEDEDLLITGVPGSGRYTLVTQAIKKIGARLIEIDCIKATSELNLINLLIKNIYKAFGKRYEDTINQKLSKILENKEIIKKYSSINDISIVQILPETNSNLLWETFKLIVNLPEQIIENPKDRVVIFLNQISHIRSWDRRKKSLNGWEEYLRNQINQNEQVSYLILETVSELEELESDITDGMNYYKAFPNCPVKVIQLKPLHNYSIMNWISNTLNKSDLNITKDGIDEIVGLVKGHIGSVESLIKRLKLICKPKTIINKPQVENAINDVLDDLSVVFESLLLMLPASQLQLIECLAIEPTGKPHSKKYRDKYNLDKGGTLQGAIKGLQQKGLIYGAEDNFQLTLPLFATWIKNNLKKAY